MTEASKPGYNLVAMHDPADRRGIWMKMENGSSFEICAGREGDDCYIKLEVCKPISSSDIEELKHIMLTGMWAIDLAHEDGHVISETWLPKRERNHND